jgi:hypothetical protein
MDTDDLIKLANILKNFASRSSSSQKRITFKLIVDEFYEKA